MKKSIKQLDDDLRAIERVMTINSLEHHKIKNHNAELKLENEMAIQDLSKIVRRKEEALVNHDCMKLEIKKIHDNLMNQTDYVFNLENKKHQVEMSMQEREREINLHKDILLAEYKAAEEERHKIAV